MKLKDGASFLHPPPTYGMEAVLWAWLTESTGVPFALSPPSVCEMVVPARRGKLRRPQASVSPPPHFYQELRDFAWREKQAPNLFPESSDFICSRVWRNLCLRVLSRTVEVLVKGNWEEICGFNKDTA